MAEPFDRGDGTRRVSRCVRAREDGARQGHDRDCARESATVGIFQLGLSGVLSTAPSGIKITVFLWQAVSQLTADEISELLARPRRKTRPHYSDWLVHSSRGPRVC